MTVSQFETVKLLLSQRPQWIAEESEGQRLAAYDFYENIYWLVPNAFKIVQRGTEQNPVYIPAARTIVETMHRYLANQVQFVPDPNFGTDQDRALATQVIEDLAKRERLYSRFSANKRMGIIRGDWAFHLYADPKVQAGSRISVFGINPGKLFKITMPDNVDEVIGWHIAEQITENSRNYVRRLTYLKQTLNPGPSPIDVTDELYEVDKWGGPGMSWQNDKPVRTITPKFTLPSPIDHLPIYHIPNFDEPEVPWGSSELRGLERIISSINQSISDEELTLALDGLGCYASDAGTPVDDNGEETTWNLGPGRVVELPEGKTFNRVSGVGSVMPYQEHVKYLHDQIDETMGMSPIAKGNVDVSVAESGVARVMEMAPLLSRVAEKEQIVTDVVSNMLFDLGKWFVAYEGNAFSPLIDAARIIPVYGDKMPDNRDAKVTELIQLAAIPSLLSPQYVRARLRSLGYEDLPDDATLDRDISAVQQAQVDLIDARMTQDIGALNGNGGSVA